MKALVTILAVLMGCVQKPIWVYLLYKILVAINAGELVWFLFWIYVPVAFICQILAGIIRKMGDK